MASMLEEVVRSFSARTDCEVTVTHRNGRLYSVSVVRLFRDRAKQKGMLVETPTRIASFANDRVQVSIGSTMNTPITGKVVHLHDDEKAFDRAAEFMLAEGFDDTVMLVWATRGRRPNVHELKCWPEPFNALRVGTKRFEFRRDDRTPRYEVGDLLKIREWHPMLDDYVDGSPELTRVVDYVLRDSFAVPEGYCVMSVSRELV